MRIKERGRGENREEKRDNTGGTRQEGLGEDNQWREKHGRSEI